MLPEDLEGCRPRIPLMGCLPCEPSFRLCHFLLFLHFGLGYAPQNLSLLRCILQAPMAGGTVPYPFVQPTHVATFAPPQLARECVVLEATQKPQHPCPSVAAGFALPERAAM